MTNNSKNTNKAVLLSIGVKDKELIERVSNLGHNFLNAFVEACERGISKEELNKFIDKADHRAIESFIKSIDNNLDEEQLKTSQMLIDNEDYFGHMLYMGLVRGLKTYQSKEYTNKEIEEIFFDLEYTTLDQEALVLFIKNNFSMDVFNEFVSIPPSIKEAILEKGSLVDIIPNISENILKSLFRFTHEESVELFTIIVKRIEKHLNLSNALKEELFGNIVQWVKEDFEECKGMHPNLSSILSFFNFIPKSKLLSEDYKTCLIKRLFIDQKFDDNTLYSFIDAIRSHISIELSESIINILERVFQFDLHNKSTIYLAINYGIIDIDVIDYISRLDENLVDLCGHLIKTHGIKDVYDLHLMINAFELEEVNPVTVRKMIEENRDRKEIEKYIEVRKLSTKEECVKYFKNEYDEEFLNSLFE